MELSLQIGVARGRTSRLCQPCRSGCGRLADAMPDGQGSVPGGQGMLWPGQPMACRGGFCVPWDAPADLTWACTGDLGALRVDKAGVEEKQQEEEEFGSRRGRRLLVSVSQTTSRKTRGFSMADDKLP